MRSRSLFSIVGALALMGAMPSGKVPAAPVPFVETYRVVEVDAFSAPTLARPGPQQALSAPVASFEQMVLQTSGFQRVAQVESLDLFMADEPLRRQVVKPSPENGTYSDSTSLASVPLSDRWRLTLSDTSRIPLRI